MNRKSISPTLVSGLLVALIFGIALWLRAYLPHDKVFVNNLIKFAGNDSYYHMRLVDNILKNFTHPNTFDPFTNYPHGTTIPWPPFFDWFLAGIIWLLSFGSPSSHFVDVVGVYYPAFLGALTIIPVYFIGKELFNRWVGVIAAGLLAIMPSDFFSRSLLGYTDHHVAEVLFTCLSLLFLILAIKAARTKLVSFEDLIHRDWASVGRPLIYSVVAGVFLGIYMLTWVGGLFFVLLLFMYFIIQSVLDHLRGVSFDYLGIIGTSLFLITTIISLLFLPKTAISSLYFPSFIIATLTPLVLPFLSRLLKNSKMALFYYPLTVLAFSLAVIAIVYLVDPSFLISMLQKLEIFTPSGASLTITEVRPLLFQNGSFTLSIAWHTLTTGFFLSFVSLGILTYLTIKQGDASKTLLLVWSLAMLLATFGQRRFGYYYAVNVALLTGYLAWQALNISGFKDTWGLKGIVYRVTKQRTTPPKHRPPVLHFPSGKLSMAFTLIVVCIIVFYPNIKPAISLARSEPLVTSDAWYSALYWLRDNTSAPFNDTSFYYTGYEPPPSGQDYNYPPSAYGVMAWWDFGHMITRLAHRIPVCNPFQQGASEVSRFLTAQDAVSAAKTMDNLGCKYVVVDYGTALSMFISVVGFGDKNIQDFYEGYYRMVDGKLTSVTFFYPEYYFSAAVRLYNFDGQGVTALKSVVISYQDKVSTEGTHYKEITNAVYFPTYAGAKAYVAIQTSGNYQIGSFNPFISPVPLEQLSQYQLIYSSNTVVDYAEVKNIPVIKIFEYQQ